MLLVAGRRLAYACIVSSRYQFVTRNLVCNRQAPAAFHQAVVQQVSRTRHIMSAAPDAVPGAAAASAADVWTTLRQLLPTVDMDTTSERQIREMLAGKLGTAMDPFKKLIKEEIDRWLTDTAVGGGGGAGSSGDDDFAPPASSLDPVGKRKRAAGEAGAPAAKVARSAATGATPQGGVQLDNKGLKWLSVSSFKGQQRVDLRNYFVSKQTGGVGPTKKGVSLSQPDWAALQAVIPAVNKALDDSDDTFVAELPSNRRATVSVFSGKLQVGVREYYEDSGELRPSMKGLNMLPDEWEVFCEAVPEINKQLANPAAAPAAAAPAATARAPAAAASAGPRKVAAPAGRGAGGAAAAAAAGAGGDAAEVQLGGKKRAAISVFTGSACVDLRECYEKDGELRPGKKGIMLRPDQWRMLVDAAGAITDALTAHNTRYTLELGNKRRVTISDFKNVWYVGVREYYEKNGELMPGQKGLSMNREQWQKLVAGMDVLTAQLG